jgi:hypothetical protein
MKRSFLRAWWIVGALGLGMAGCQETQKKAAVDKSKPDDPTSWSARELSRGDASDSGTANGLSRSSRTAGTWSDEAQSVERSLGVGR